MEKRDATDETKIDVTERDSERGPFVIFMDIETVTPRLFSTSLVFGDTQPFRSDQYQVNSAKIWQMACICSRGRFFDSNHPGFDLRRMSNKSLDFIRKYRLEDIWMIPVEKNFVRVWNNFTDWLNRVSGDNREIVFVAQQACGGDEVVLSIEMARYDLKWPADKNISFVEILPSIKKTFSDLRMERPVSWSVRDIFSKLSNGMDSRDHIAIEDTLKLFFNAEKCFQMRTSSSSKGMIRSNATGDDASEFRFEFWRDVMTVLNWSPHPQKQHRDNIWHMITHPHSDKPCSRILALQLEKMEIHTIADLVVNLSTPCGYFFLGNADIVRSQLPNILSELERRSDFMPFFPEDVIPLVPILKGENKKTEGRRENDIIRNVKK